jgi:site-specific DNA-methyltransferase (adenine-specific)
MSELRLINNDCKAAMADMEENSVGCFICDPPYGLEFMGKKWDSIGDVRQPGDSNYQGVDNPYGRSKVRYGHGASYRGKGTGSGQQDWHHDWLVEAFRTLQPGGVIKAFSGTRTFHRLAAAMEDVGFIDIRLEAWTYGSGFPKSLNIGKALDKAAGAENSFKPEYDRTAPATEEARIWNGWGTAVKPAWEPVVVGRKP